MRRTLAAAAVAAVAGWFGACGGGDDDAGVRALLDDAFSRPIATAIVTVDVEVQINGIDELRDPLRLQLTGPYRSGGEGRIPAFDWDVSFTGGGQTIAGGLLSTSDNVFVNFQGTDYEIGEDAIGGLNAELAEAAGEGEGQTLTQFGIDPSNWLEEADEKGEETVAGVETTRVSAKIDVAKMLDDLNALVDRAGAAVPGSGPAPKLDEEQQRRIEDVLGEPTLDVYVGVDDKVVRRLSADLELDVPEGSRERLGGIEGGTIAFSIEFARVGEPVEIAAPRSARPIEELTGQLGALRGGDGFDRYTECLEQADPSRIGEIQACSDLLQ